MLIYNFTLSQVAVVLGLFVVLASCFSLWKAEAMKKWLLNAHRNFFLGVGLFAAATAWTIWFLMAMDLMEYTPQRNIFIIVVLIMAALVIRYLPEYLSVRAMGILLLLGANVLLDAAFLRDEASKYVITVLAYLWIIEGMFLVGMPYLFRDMMSWFYKNEKRIKIAIWTKFAFGILLLALGFFVY